MILMLCSPSKWKESARLGKTFGKAKPAGAAKQADPYGKASPHREENHNRSSVQRWIMGRGGLCNMEIKQM